MNQSGGPAAINGFLYQILHHLGHITEIGLRASDPDLNDAGCELILEPINGGDAQVWRSTAYVVEQYKTRGSGTWSVQQIIDEVLPDLRKAVRPELPQECEYRFLTDGGRGRLDAFDAFLERVRGIHQIDDLDDKESRSFWSNSPKTDRALARHIAERSRSKGLVSRDDEDAVVLHLLAHLRLRFDVSADSLVPRIEALLRRYVNDLGDETGVRERLIGILVHSLATGEVHLGKDGIDILFRNVGLDPSRLRRLAHLSETVAELVQHRLNRIGYSPDLDVREESEWPLGASVVLIAGESGMGKSWRLARTAYELGERRQLVTFIHSVNDCELVLRRASNDIWQAGLGATSEKSLEALKRHYVELMPDVQLPWMTVIVDDLHELAVARELVRQDWMRWGIRIVASVPPLLATALEETEAESVHIESVGHFSVPQLDDLLSRRGRRWRELPSDLKVLLRNPILAGTYIAIAEQSFRNAPQSEYEIFDRYWARIRAQGGQGDDGILFALAEDVLRENPYPVSRRHWGALGIHDEAPLERLEAAGWLRVGEGGELSFAHDRFMNWAVARMLTHKVDRNNISLIELKTALTQCIDPGARRLSRRLNYVAMDALWHLLENERHIDLCDAISGLFEESGQFGSYGESLYLELLPTLGKRVIALLLRRLARFEDGPERDYRSSLIAKTFVAMSPQNHPETVSAIEKLLHSDLPSDQQVAIEVLKSVPNSGCLQQLWLIHQRRTSELAMHSDSSSAYRDSAAALRAAVALDPDWLTTKILEVDPALEPVEELAYILKNLRHPRAEEIWPQVREVLISKVSKDRPRSILHCIGRFRDTSHLDYLMTCLHQKADYASPAAFANLALLDPELAVENLARLEQSVLCETTSWWLPTLLHAKADDLKSTLLKIAHERDGGLRFIERIYAERTDDLDLPTLAFYLDSLEADLRQVREQGVINPDALYRPLRFLAAINRKELISLLEQRAGSDLEQFIVDAACKRVGQQPGVVDHLLENARRLLLFMGGQGIETLVHLELTADEFWTRQPALQHAYIYRSSRIVKRLADLARRELSMDSQGNPDARAIQEHYQSTVALAALGADQELIDAVWNYPSVPVDVSALRDKVPVDVVHTRKALTVLTSSGPSDAELTRALTVAWLSADAGFIPHVRSILAGADPHSSVAALSCIALTQLGDTSEAFAHLASKLLHTTENSSWGRLALRGMGSTGLALVKGFLQSKPISTWDEDDEALLGVLHKEPSTRTFAVESAVRFFLARAPSEVASPEIAAEGGDPTIRSAIVDCSFIPAADGGISLTAIGALAGFDVPRAVEAIEDALLASALHERELCNLMVRLDPTAATAKLLDIAVTANRRTLPFNVGRAMRRLEPAHSEIVLTAHLRSGEDNVRAMASKVVGWMPTRRFDGILNILATDADDNVREAALGAIERRRREQMILSLYRDFELATEKRRWVLLTAVLDVGDPYLLTTRADSLWLGNILDDAPYAYAYHAQRRLVERKRDDT